MELTKIARMLDLLRSWNANIVCMAETQTSWEMYSVREKVGQELRRYDRNAGMMTSSSATAKASVVKPGGTMTIWNGNWNSRIVKRGSDPYK